MSNEDLPATVPAQTSELAQTLAAIPDGMRKDFIEIEIESRLLAHYQRIGDAMCKAGMQPKGMNAAGVSMVMMKGHELGLKPSVALSQITAVNGRFSVMNELALAIIRREGVLVTGTDLEVEWFGGDEYMTDDAGKVERDTSGKPKSNPAYGCRVRLHRKGHQKPFEAEYTVRDAIVMGKWGSGIWAQHPKRMLQARPTGNLIKDHFSDVVMGLTMREADPEEVVETSITATVDAPTGGDAPEDGFLEALDEAMGAPDSNDPPPPSAEQPEDIIVHDALAVDAPEPSEPDDGEERVIEGEVSNPIKFRVECLQCGAADLYTPGKSDCTRGCGFVLWLDDNGYYVDEPEPEQGSLV